MSRPSDFVSVLVLISMTEADAHQYLTRKKVEKKSVIVDIPGRGTSGDEWVL